MTTQQNEKRERSTKYICDIIWGEDTTKNDQAIIAQALDILEFDMELLDDHDSRVIVFKDENGITPPGRTKTFPRK